MKSPSMKSVRIMKMSRKAAFFNVVQTVSLSRTFLFSILSAVFIFAYGASSYWKFFKSGSLNTALFFALILIAGVWAILVSGQTHIQIVRSNFIVLCVLAVALVLLNIKPMVSVIPWRGDEDYHMEISLEIVRGLPYFKYWLLILLTLFFVAAGMTAKRWIIAVAATVLIGYVYWFSLHHPVRLALLTRYPFFIRWFHAFAPMAIRRFTFSYYEWIYRIVPLISAILISWILTVQIHSKGIGLRIFWGLAVGTLPVVWYYSSILYLEMPAVLLMMAVCVEADTLLADSFSEIRKHPSWYALILIGFIKETAFPFLAAFISARILIRLRLAALRRIRTADLADDVKIIFCVFIPLIVFLLFRSPGTERPFHFQYANLIEVKVYSTLLRAFAEQFGLYFILFLAGLGILIRKKKYSILLWTMMSFCAIPLFHAIDTLQYTGYSRFNLFLIPVFSVGVLACVRTRLKFAWILPVAVLTCNFILSPINIDGTKKPYWGNYLCDTSEHYYPYDRAIQWCKENHSSDKILFTGMYYPYMYGLYFQKYQWFPQWKESLIDSSRNDTEGLIRAFQIASEDTCSVIVYHIRNKDVSQAVNGKNYTLERVFRNRAHALAVFSRTPPLAGVKQGDE